MKLGDMKCPWEPGKTMRECVTIHEGPPLTVRHINDITKRCSDPQCPDWEHGEHIHEPWPRTTYTAAPGPDGVVCAHGCDAWSISQDCNQHKTTERPVINHTNG